MARCEFTDGYDFTEHSASGSDVSAGWIVVVLVNLFLIAATF